MARSGALVGVMLLLSGFRASLLAADPPTKLTPQERKAHEAKWAELTTAGMKAYSAGKLAEAVKPFEAALEVSRGLYPKDAFPDGHPNLALSLNNLAELYRIQGNYAVAEPLHKDVLEMKKRLFKGDHPSLATSLNNLALLYLNQGKYAAAEPLLQEALEMHKRLFKGDHLRVASSLNTLALLYGSQGKYAAAEVLYRETLEMHQRLFKGDHATVAQCQNALATVYGSQKKYAAAEPLLKDALAMRRRLFQGDHPDVAQSLNNLAVLYTEQKKYATAEPLYKDTLEMWQRLFKGDHPTIAQSLHNLATVYGSQGKYAAAEPLCKDALAMRQRLFKGDHPDVAQSQNNLAELFWFRRKYAAAEPLFQDALAMRRRLYKNNHPDVATSLNNLAGLYNSQGKYAAAEPIYKEALAVRQRLFKGDHPDVAQSMNNLAELYREQGKYAVAEPLHKDALAMRQRLFKGDHTIVAESLNNLASLYRELKKYAAAEPLYKDALAMRTRLFKKDDYHVALSLNNLAALYSSQGEYAAAEALYKDALEMTKRLFQGDHPAVAASLNNLAALYGSQGKHTAAEPLHKDALAMRQRLYKGDHPDVAGSLHNLALQYLNQGKYAAAEPLFKDALAMYRCLAATYARDKPEGEALTFLTRLPRTRDAFLSNELQATADPAAAYPPLWFEKGALSRVYELRQSQARAAVADPKAARKLAELAEARRRRAELLLAPATEDRDTQTQRDKEIARDEARIAELSRELRPLLPSIPRADRLAEAEPIALRQVLPADAALVDYLLFFRSEQDQDKPGKEGQSHTFRYLAFVITKDKIAWVELATAARVEAAVTAWRAAITSGKDIDPALPAGVRKLVWQDVRKLLPATVKTVYLSPDAALSRVPFAALPGDKPGTVLLDDFALAAVPHAQFLLDRLWPQDLRPNPPTAALAVGGVQYDAEASVGSKVRGEPLVKEGAKLGWSVLPSTSAEADGFLSAARRQQLPTTRLDGEKATPAALLAALPKARLAHLATHGFFADPSFRSLFQLDEKEYEQSRRGERIGRVANNPLLMSGLVLAGANKDTTPGRGIVTGEALIDLDLSGLELAVLSACETGLGDVAGGEGTFSLQRAFHLAGTQNVIASLWKVPDEATAALMALFYRNLWDKKQPPIESLRQAQLELYRNPGRIGELAKGFRGKFVEVPGMGGEVTLKPNKDGTAHPLLWAAFSLSGAGR